MNQINLGSLYIKTALVILLSSLFFGCLASLTYLLPEFLKDTFGLVSLRPMHVSAAVFWILLSATACVYFGLNQLFPERINKSLALMQYMLWIIAVLGVFYSYFNKQFGGREYWEFNPIWAIPIALAWILFLVQFFKTVSFKIKWPVYLYMWMTGLIFFIYIFIENYLWLIPYFNQNIIKDITIQWKVNGSLVGAWNQILYGTLFYLMDKISGNSEMAYGKTTFTMYFLGLFNMLFNWSHHIYTVPTQEYIRYVGYLVSMTEWIFLLKTLFQWKTEISEIRKYQSIFAFRFIAAANIWVFLNLIQALIMSVPAFNLYTHGTHITVAHAMGTTIGINTMIILSASFFFLSEPNKTYSKQMHQVFWLTQIGLFMLWLGLVLAGVYKGFWQMSENAGNFSSMIVQSKPFFMLFVFGGFILSIGIGILGVYLIRMPKLSKS